MFEARIGSRAAVAAAFAFVALSASYSGSAAAKPKVVETKDAAAARIEQKALRAYVAGDLPAAIGGLEQALRKCEPPFGCAAATRARLHVSLGTVRGVGEGDYAAAKKEFVSALSLDPKAHLRAVSTPQLTTAFEDARNETSTKPAAPETPDGAAPEKAPPEKTTPPEKTGPAEKPPEKPVTVSDLFRQDENAPPPNKPAPPTPPADTGPTPRRNWLSIRPVFDFAYISDANICSPGAPSSYFCTDERGARYTGRPQRNDEISPGFGFSVARLVLGYERLLFAGFTAGAFAGYAFNFAPSAKGRDAGFPLHLEARATYTFGDSPYVDGAGRFHPFVYVAAGAADFDTHVIIRVNEIPCGSKISAACKRDLNAYRLVGGVFTTLGGGVRYQIEGRHALRAAMRGTVVLGDGSFVFSPEIAYEFGL